MPPSAVLFLVVVLSAAFGICAAAAKRHIDRRNYYILKAVVSNFRQITLSMTPEAQIAWYSILKENFHEVPILCDGFQELIDRVTAEQANKQA